MQLIKSNPYRTVGLLVGATAREQARQIQRLNQFIDAEQEPEDDFSFPALGKIIRTIDNVTDSASKLNLDSDKMNASLFWFYNGNSITDEAAFDAIKDNDLDQAINIWTKQTSNPEVTSRNASAYSNLGTLYLCHNSNEYGLEKGISLKLKFLESDFIKDFKALATDETYKTTKKELQLIFLNHIQTELDKNGGITINKFLEILSKQTFSAKEDFLKDFAQKPIEQIERQIEESKSKRKINKAYAITIGENLMNNTNKELTQIKSILGYSNLKYSSIADKVANELLQCSIDYFNHYQEIENDIDYFEPAHSLAKKCELIAVGSLIKERISDSLNTLKEMKDKEILQAIEILKSVKDSYVENEKEIRTQVKKLEQEDFEIRLGHKSINRKAVEDNIKNSINWQKVNELIVSVISDKNLVKIKESDNSVLKKEFIEIANWLKLTSQKNNTITVIIDKYSKIPPKLPFKIISSEITNTDKNNNPLPITNPLYKKHTRYIGILLKVECSEAKAITFNKKYINPSGSYSTNEKISPKGYTNSTTKEINKNTKTIDLSGWGSNDSCTYSVGKHKIEIYVDEYMIYSKDFIIDLAPSEKLEIELKKAEDQLNEIVKTEYFKSEISNYQIEMAKIKEWQFMRSQADRESQINNQQLKINNLLKKSEDEKKIQISNQNTKIADIKTKIQKAEY